MHDVAGFHGVRLQALDHIRIVALRRSRCPDCPACGDGQVEIAGKRTDLCLRIGAKRKQQRGKLRHGRRKQEVALIAGCILGAIEFRAARSLAQLNIVASGQQVRA